MLCNTYDGNSGWVHRKCPQMDTECIGSSFSRPRLLNNTYNTVKESITSMEVNHIRSLLVYEFFQRLDRDDLFGRYVAGLFTLVAQWIDGLDSKLWIMSDPDCNIK